MYYSFAAVPLFGLGQTLLPANDTVARHHAFVYLFLYLGAALGLLITTSFLGLRRYLRQRYVSMPGKIALGWIQTGVIAIVTVLCLTLLLPRPGAREAWATLRYHVDHQLRKASDFAARFNPHGTGNGRSGNDSSPNGQDENKSPSDSDQNTDNQGNDNGKGNQQAGGGSGGGGGGGGGGGESSGGSSGHAGEQGSGDKQPEQKAKEPKPKPPDQNAPDNGPSGVSVKASPHGPPPDSMRVFVGCESCFGSRWPSGWAGCATGTARCFWPCCEASGPPFNRLSPCCGICSNAPPASRCRRGKNSQSRPLTPLKIPFLTGGDQIWPPERLIAYTYAALQSWVLERETAQGSPKTPREFCGELAEEMPEAADALGHLALSYGHVAYGASLPGNYDAAHLRLLWDYMASPRPKHVVGTAPEERLAGKT